MKHMKKAICFIMIILIAIGACGCMNTIKEQFGHSNAEYIVAIEKYLGDKYSLSFKVESLGGEYGTYDNTTVKAWCYSTESENASIKFMAEIDKEDLTIVKDNYLHVVAASEISKKILSTCAQNAKAYSVVESGTYSNDVKIEILDNYLDQLGAYFVTTHLFIKDSSSFTANEYADIVYSIGKNAESLGLRDVLIVVWFVDDLSVDIDTTFTSTQLDKLYDEYLGKNYVNRHASIQLTEEGISTDYDSLKSVFEKDVK